MGYDSSKAVLLPVKIQELYSTIKPNNEIIVFLKVQSNLMIGVNSLDVGNLLTWKPVKCSHSLELLRLHNSYLYGHN